MKEVWKFLWIINNYANTLKVRNPWQGVEIVRRCATIYLLGKRGFRRDFVEWTTIRWKVGCAKKLGWTFEDTETDCIVSIAVSRWSLFKIMKYRSLNICINMNRLAKTIPLANFTNLQWDTTNDG